MAKEISDAECWEAWKASGNPELEQLADQLAPHISVTKEMMDAVDADDRERVLFISSIIRRYTNPKDEWGSMDDAYRALMEIREYKP
jgi:hypothetical protein